jgi:acetylornithine deacetylase/succinyl-diaminopimelate desuccinylase-like protein
MVRRKVWLACWTAVALGLLITSCARAGPGLSEAARWLQGYLQIDTTNPPGNEHLAASYLAQILHREGISTQLLVTPRGRTSLMARLPSGRPEAETLLLLHHMDVVPPGPGWSVEPFSGVVRKGQLWGRGAIDTKGLGITQLAALIDLKRRRLPLERDVLFLGVADEEQGGGEGTAWLVENHPELLSGVVAAINEGGANRMVNGRLLWWGVEVAQKRPLWLEVTARGRGGHASGFNPHSANHQLVLGLARLLEMPPRYRVSPAVRAYLEALAPLHNEHWQRIFNNIDELVADRELKTGLLPGMVNLLVDSVQVTVLESGEEINVVPDRASARIDIRLLPETDAEAFLEEARQRLGDGLETRVLLTAPATEASPTANFVYRGIAQVFEAEGPVVPAFIPGLTDSRYLRARGIPSYGVSPFALEGPVLRGIHGPDERIPLAELDRGVERMVQILEACAVSAEP